MMPLCVNLEDGTMKPLTSLFHAPVHSPYRIPTGRYASNHRKVLQCFFDIWKILCWTWILVILRPDSFHWNTFRTLNKCNMACLNGNIMFLLYVLLYFFICCHENSFSIHTTPETFKFCINRKIHSFYKGLAHHQPTVSLDGYTASIRPGVVSCSKSALILTNSVCIQSCKLRSLLVSVTLLKEFQAFLTFLVRNPLPEGLHIFHITLHCSLSRLTLIDRRQIITHHLLQ